MTILVTGATGNVGRSVVDQLVEAGRRVRALTRRPKEAELPDVVEVVQGNLAHIDTLPAVFDGVESVFLFPTPVLNTAPAVVDVAKRAGVRRIVLLSSSRPFESVERAIEESGLEWTHVRPGEFAVNKLDYWAKSIREEGVARMAYPEARGVPVHEADIAAVAVAALLDDRHAGRVYDVTGPEALTQREQVRAISEGIGKPVEFQAVSPDEARDYMTAQGWPREIADYYLAYLAEWEAQPPKALRTVEEVTGRPARTLAEWAADHADSFR
ncbi:NmrA family NAD(P)-binding protein [Marinitenerispora sediminis]|uniref:NmrA family transcriptional regulator n=1 Tax=Marinitenerispora sediminis TaxID=1931232 RepID=A0A368T247_9ACTN|nr:NmrA family NAD(P)-binding protein [Marinitenerispora sediminis]RCV48889.1 NmrA family transcriptional regulator [Marinitenerispora sediminis]RCV51339.1 NmrA family transcriptional regulator [Marinitenerispora sediminis]RCV54926.1 NmrA family transcriptional regulator [Marinitenerispora sediminis]